MQSSHIRASACALFLLVSLCGCTKHATDYRPGVSFMQHVTPAASQGEGAPAPDFTWLDSSGKTVSFKDYTKGKPALINFWATWCGPCRREIPELKKITQEYTPKGLVVISVETQDWHDPSSLSLDYVGKFAADWKLNYPVVIEGKNHDEKPLWDAYGLSSGIPVSVLVDRQGKIVKTLLGGHSEEQFAAELNKLL
jgi:thiol-disulfide isomerase/thioredoxin